jgi:hypothetical protein
MAVAYQQLESWLPQPSDAQVDEEGEGPGPGPGEGGLAPLVTVKECTVLPW